MKNNFKRLALATASVGMLTIYGCGGGGDTQTEKFTDQADVGPTYSTKVTPSLGQFSVGTVVNLTKPDGSVLDTGTITDVGSVTLTYAASYTGPIIVNVMGGSGVTYFDEKDGSYQSFGVGSKLKAVLPAPQKEAGVTALTNAAAENLVTANSIDAATATTVNEANAKVAAVFGLRDILIAPTPVNSRRKTLYLALPNDKYALVLAAFAKAAPKGTSTASFAEILAIDLKDSKLDSKYGSLELYYVKTDPKQPDAPKKTLPELMVPAYQEAAKEYATEESEKVAAAAPMTITKDVTLVRPVPNQSDVELAKALFSELRTTLNSFANDKATGFLDAKATSIRDDINANVAPELSKVSDRISVLNNAMTMYEDAKAYSSSKNNGFTAGTDPVGTDKKVLIRSSGSMMGAWFGYDKYTECWTDSITPASITKISCAAAGTDSADRINNKLKFVLFVLTADQSASNQYTYTATRYNKPVSFGTASWMPIFAPSTQNEVPISIPQGKGSLSKTVSGATITSMTFNGTMPPSTISTDVDTIAISAIRTELTGSNFRYALSGSVSATNAANTSKKVTLSLDSGTYFDADETDVNNTMLTTAKIVGAAQTSASKFNGTFDLGSVQKDSKGVNPLPTAWAFTGVISDLSTSGAGEFLSGKLEAAITNYNTYDSNAGKFSTNFMTGTVAFTGTVQAPDRPQLKLVLAGTKTGLTTSTITLNYSYGSGISITGSGLIDTTNPTISTMTLSNQAGIQFVVKQNAPTEVTKAGVKLATISNNLINYIDGVSESF